MSTEEINPAFDPNWFTGEDDIPVSQEALLEPPDGSFTAQDMIEWSEGPGGPPSITDQDMGEGALPPRGPQQGQRKVFVPADVITQAIKDLGYKEKPVNLTKFGKWYKLDGNPWCAMAVSYWYWKAGMRKGACPRAASCTAAMKWAKEHGMWVENPNRGRPGDMAILNKDEGAGKHTIVHTGLVVANLGNGLYYLIEGNTNDNGSPNGDGVYPKQRRAQRIVGFVRPRFDARAGIRLRYVRPGLTNHHVRIVQDALEKEYDLNLPGMGTYGPRTREAVARWQSSLGDTGPEAEGVLDLDSATKLGKKHNFLVISGA